MDVGECDYGMPSLDGWDGGSVAWYIMPGVPLRWGVPARVEED